MYNILPDAYLTNVSSGTGYTQRALSAVECVGLANQSAVVTVSGGYYLGLEASFGMDLVCSEARVYSSHLSSGNVLFHYREFVGNEWHSNGMYNYNTDYSTPKMESNLDPEPYAATAASEWSSSWCQAYHAFTQTNSDTLDCWLTAQSGGAPPQSLVFYFPYPKVINKYALQSRNDSNSGNRYFPKVFMLQGNTVASPSITTDSHWVTLDTRSGIADPGQAAWSDYFTFENAIAYNYYRLKVTAVSTGSRVAVGELQLVEANRVESVAVSNWYERALTWNGNYYSYVFPDPTGIEMGRFFFKNSGSVATVSGMALYTPDVIVVSGVVASGIFVNTYALTHQTLDAFPLRIQNNTAAYRQPLLAFGYTGNYEIDRNLLLSPDYGVSPDKNTAQWYGLENGYVLPEKLPFDSGILINTQTQNRQVILQDTQVSGCWLSPVIDTQNIPLSAYTYSQGNTRLYARAADSAPPLVNFLVVTTNPKHQWLMYDHKRVYLDSSGEVIGQNICGSTGSKIWRSADETWAGTPLDYHGSINERGTVSFLAPGYTDCADMSPEQEFLNPNYWYNLSTCTLDASSRWSRGVTVSGLVYGTDQNIVMTKTFPVNHSDGFFCFSFVFCKPAISTYVSLSFVDGERTLGSFPLFSKVGNISPSMGIDVAYDQANNGWWIYLNFDLYKVDLGSINNVRTFAVDDGSGYNASDSLTGYIWRVAIAESWKKMVSIPSNSFNYFWVFNATEIYLYEETYVGDTPSIILRATITQGVQVDMTFAELHCGSCDEYGNLWVLDLEQQRVCHIDLKKALLGDPLAVDYENQIAGAINLWAHPTDNTCYVLISDEPEHPDQDIIRKIHMNQRWGSQGKYICAVPGFCSVDYKYGVSFTGKAFSNGIRPQAGHDTWGSDGGLTWVPYDAVGCLLPRGRYKQLKVELTRPAVHLSSPRLQRLRVPNPVVLEPLARGQSVDIAMKATLNKARVAGHWDTKLKVWWYDEEV